MKTSEIAKNLLENKTCSTCSYCYHGECLNKKNMKNSTCKYWTDSYISNILDRIERKQIRDAQKAIETKMNETLEYLKKAYEQIENR